MTGGALKISGTWTRERERTRRTYRSVKKVFRTFERAIPFYCAVDRDRVVATLRDDAPDPHPEESGVTRAFEAGASRGISPRRKSRQLSFPLSRLRS